MVEDLTHKLWRALDYQPGSLNSREQALGYFRISEFYDQNCKNEELVLRGRPFHDEDEIRGMGGDKPEYLIVDEQPPVLWVIRKQSRAGGQMRHLAYYYILDGDVFQASSLHAIIAARMRRVLQHVKTGFALVQEDLAPLRRLASEQAQRAASTAEQVAAEASKPLPVPRVDTPQEIERWNRTDAIIMTSVRRYAVPALPMPRPPGMVEPPAPPAAAAALEAQAAAAPPAQAAAAADGRPGKRQRKQQDAEAAAAAERFAEPVPVQVPKQQRSARGGRQQQQQQQQPPQTQQPPQAQQQHLQQPEPSIGSHGTHSAGRQGSLQPAPSVSTVGGSTISGSRVGGLKIKIKLPGVRAPGSSGGGASGGSGGGAEPGASGEGGQPASKRARLG